MPVDVGEAVAAALELVGELLVIDAQQMHQGGVEVVRRGIQQFGLAENGVGYVYDANNKALIPDAVRARLDTLTADIVAGRIKVPSTR